jgi:predicted ATPase/signal transduction histidine kinase
MGPDGALSGRDPPVRAEVVQESARTRVTRVVFAGRTVIRKEPRGPDAERRLRHETAILERLRGAEGLAQLAEGPRYPGAILLADASGTSLAAQCKPLAADDLIGLALQLARAVAGMHRRGVMHRDITPTNILVSSGGVLCLVDFALATSFAEIRLEFTHHTQILGTLAYLAPEQTGRTGRPTDQRADLYALGATLYELATGGPPFGTGDPLRLTHDHLARVPAPPAAVNHAMPEALSAIIMHLLEKEPDNRYQTAEGVLYDLTRLRDAGTRPAPGALRVGEHDYPLRLLPPSRLVGRDDEVAALRAAFDDAGTGRCRGVLITGAPGVGKTALADELRPVVTGRDGWFVAGKFDAYRRDLEFDATNQAFRALGRLLLAEPEDELARVRARILAATGANAGLLAATVPELAALLAVPPDPGDPLTAQVRAQQAAVQLLRAVASRKRPLVLFLDDLQWAGRPPLGVVDLLLSEEPVEGLLLVGAYREDEVTASHPLASMVSRWQRQTGLEQVRLDNLPTAGSVTMVAEMLHVDPAAASGLAEVISPYTSGNPYETVELLNVLRGDGVLTATAAGWRWDDAAVRAHLGQSELAELLVARVEAMPEQSRAVLEAMACLGGRAELSLVQTATAASAGVVDRELAPALEEGLLVMEPGVHEAIRFRHDRIREVILRGLDPARRCALQLAMARRLAAVPELFAAAAEQYLEVADEVRDATERRVAAELLRRAALQATLIGGYSLVDALLAAALRLVDSGDTAVLVSIHTGRHAALYSLGRHDEADEEYRAVEALCPDATGRADATAVQVRSLTLRKRFAEAISLGTGALREFGIAVPPADRLPDELGRLFGVMYRWLDQTETADDLARPALTEPALLAATRLINATLPAAYFAADHPMLAWLGMEAMRIWIEDGPGPTLLGAASHAAYAPLALRGDYAAAYRTVLRILALGEARGYEPGTSQARYLFGDLCCWFEPIENGIQAVRRAREGLITGGGLASAGYSTYHPTVTGLLDCAPVLDACVGEVESAVAFVRRTSNEEASQWLDSYRWLASVLRGDSSAAGEAVAADKYAGNPFGLLHAHLTRAIAAAVFDNQAGLAQHTAAAMPLLPTALGTYVTGVTRALRGLALAQQVRIADGDERAGLLTELDEVARWLAARAADAPENFLHLLRLVEAERAWAADDFRAASIAFDAARHETLQRQRPWHRALTAERAARFYLAHGLDHAGHYMLAQARQVYLAWGAAAKVAQLDWAYPALRPRVDATTGHDAHPDADHRAAVTTGTIDLLGILSASQVLSSETILERLHARVAQVLSAMTGATRVQLPLWDDERQDWLLPARDSGGRVLVSGVGRNHAVPMSVLRYAQRVRDPLVVSDTTRDDRFARDPYFADADCCSLLAVPIFSRGTLRAVLLLENRLLRSAFSAERLDGVRLIAGQLAVSLDNAQVYAEFQRVAGEQAALRRVATLVARSAPPGEVFAAVAQEAGKLLAADFAIVDRYDAAQEAIAIVGTWTSTGAPAPTPVGSWLPLGGRNVSTAVCRTGRPARIDYSNVSGVIGEVATHDWGLCSSVGVPISVKGRLWGVVVVALAREDRLPGDTEARLANFTELMATAIANADAQTEVTASRARIVAAADTARRRIERDLHDGAQQRLVSLTLNLRAARAAIPPELRELGADLAHIETGLSDALEELREIARGIHPAVLAEGGLAAALRALARRSPVPAEIDMRAEGRLPEHVEVSAYYIVAEALTNVARHARASAVTVTVNADAADAVLRVVVRDDGAGGADFARGTGLVGLKDRVEALGGRIFLDSPPGAGTSLRAELPLSAGHGGVALSFSRDILVVIIGTPDMRIPLVPVDRLTAAVRSCNQPSGGGQDERDPAYSRLDR